MSTKVKSGSKEKELKLLEKLEETKRQLLDLQVKRMKEIGQLAYKHGLENFENQILDKAFAKLAKELC